MMGPLLQTTKGQRHLLLSLNKLKYAQIVHLKKKKAHTPAKKKKSVRKWKKEMSESITNQIHSFKSSRVLLILEVGELEISSL